MWSDPCPKLSSPHNDNRLASIKFPKNFQPVGTSNISKPLALATLQDETVGCNELNSYSYNENFSVFLF